MDKGMEKEKRNTSIELFRIITMLMIVGSHYVVNSDLLKGINRDNLLTVNSIFSIVLGGGGKIGINCFVLITGYFMCKSRITLKKFLKLLCEIEFYNIVIYLIFVIMGNEVFSLTGIWKNIFPFYTLGSSFVPSFLVFYIFIPFLNILLNSMSRNQHKMLIGLLIVVDCLLQTFLFVPDAFTYLGWFVILYIIAAYIRFYSQALFENKKLWLVISIVAIICSILSVLFCIVLSYIFDKSVYYWFVSDSNKILALLTSVSMFVFFKNIKLNYHPVINWTAESTFGVLLIHANSQAMSHWLWTDLLRNTTFFNKSPAIFISYSIITVLGVYLVCSVIDRVRICVLEKPLMKYLDKVVYRGKKVKMIESLKNCWRKW